MRTNFIYVLITIFRYSLPTTDNYFGIMQLITPKFDIANRLLTSLYKEYCHQVYLSQLYVVSSEDATQK